MTCVLVISRGDEKTTSVSERARKPTDKEKERHRRRQRAEQMRLILKEDRREKAV
jgi:hypothetical protein